MQRYKFLLLLLISVLTCLTSLESTNSSGEDLSFYLPISNLTPGVTNPDVTQANIASTICTAGYTKTIRPPSTYTTSLKIKQLAADYKRYGSTKTSFVEEDHLIPLEIGGNPKSSRNLWPQLWDGAWGAHKKDQLENKIHSLVCSKAMSLEVAQGLFATNWIEGYKVYILGQTPTPTPTPTPTQEVTITPGAFCSPAGAIARSSTGVTYTCKTSPTDSRNRWRQ